MKALVTGGSGFIGSHLIDELSILGHQTFNFDFKLNRDVRDPFHLQKVVSKFRPDVIFHLAGVLGTSELMERVKEAEEINVVGTINVLDVCKKFDVPLIYTGKTNPPDWLNPYTITKRSCERYCEMYREQWNVKVCVVKPFNVYGPGQKSTVQKYVPTFIQKALEGKDLPVWGTGNQMVDPVYIKDTVEALVRACRHECWGETIEVGSGEGCTVIDVAGTIIELTRSKSKIKFLPMRPGEPLLHEYPVIANVQAMKKLLGMSPEEMVQLPDGITRTISWWKSA